MRTSILLVLFILFPSNARSGESSMACPNFRLDEAERSMSRLPIYDQGKLDTCYAYTAAQMLDAYRFSHRTRSSEAKPSSPLAIAIGCAVFRREGNIPRPRAGMDGGDVQWTINTVRAIQPGVCSEEAFSTHLTRQAQSAETLRALSRLRELNENSLKARDPNQARIIAESLRQFLIGRGFTDAMIRNLGDLTMVMNTQMAPQFFQRIAAETCRGREINLRGIPAPSELVVHQAGSSGDSRESDFGLLLRRMFSSANPQPIGIEYCANFLMNGDLVRNDEVTSERENCKAHASVIIGSRERNGSCEFLIRNTFGNDCSRYENRWQCENGQAWVRDSALVKNTNKAIWIGGPAVR